MGRRTAGFAVLCALSALATGCSAGQIANSVPPAGPYQVVSATARNWSWTLSARHLKAGEEVKFIVRSLEAVHGFSIVGTNVSTAVTQGDRPAVVYWKPPAPGVYTLACNVYCGAGHDAMHTEFTVS